MSTAKKIISSTVNAQLLQTSKFKNITHEVQNKTNLIQGIQLGQIGETALSVSSKFFAVPWKSVGDCSMYVGLLNKYEKIGVKPKLIKAHKSQITSFQFAPFNDNLLLTGSKDATVKLWKIDDNGLVNDIVDPLAVFQHESRMVSTQFHPLVDGLISTASEDGIVRMYDISRPDEVMIELEQNVDGILSMAWEGGYGNNLMTIGKDLNYRLYDPRDSSRSITTFCVGETVKGLKGMFLDGTDYFVSTGFSRNGERVVNLFDQRKEGLLGRVIVDKQPHPLNMYYDDNNNLMYLTGKGNSMFTYDIQGKNMVMLKNANIIDGVGGCAMIQQRKYDVKRCEVGRFMILNQKTDTLFNITYGLNRRDADTIYQEDLYQNVKGPGAEYTIQTWTNPDTVEMTASTGKKSQQGSKYNADTKRRKQFSLQPEGMTSVFDLKVDEGGRDRAKELLDQANKSTNKKKKMKKIKYSGAFEEIQRGWIFNSYIMRWFEMNDKYLMFFTNRDDAKPSTTIFLNHIKSFTAAPEVKGKVPITIELEEECEEVKEKKALPRYTYFVQSETDAYEWIMSYKILRTLYEEQIEKEKKAEEERKKEMETQVVQKKTKEEQKKEQESKYETCGNVYMIKKTMFGTIKRKFLYIEKGVLYSQNVTWWGQQPTGTPEMECFLNRIIHLSKSEGIFPASYKEFTFQLTTKGNVFHFACDNEKDMEKWMKACTPNALKREDADEGLSDFTQAPAQEGMQYFFSGLFGGYTNVFVSLVANELFVFRNKTDTNPVVKIYLQEIEKIEVNKETQEMIIQMEIKDKKAIQHKFKTSEYAVWKDEILDRKKRTLDLLTELGIRDKILSLDNTIQEEYVTKEAKEADEMFLDTNKFLKGEPTVLLQIKGKKRVHPHIVPVKQEQLNPCNSYVLITDKQLYSWTGQFAPRGNSARATQTTDKIVQKERNRCPYTMMTHQKQDTKSDFFKIIGCEPTPYVKDAKTTENIKMEDYKNIQPADEQDKEKQDIIRIYRIMHNENNENNPLQITMVHENSTNVLPPKELLKKGSCSIVTTSTEIYIWQSSSSTPIGRRVASIIARELAKKINPILMLKLNENGEFFLFKIKFSNYRDTLAIDVGGAEEIKVRQTERRPQREKEVMIEEIEKQHAPHFTEIMLNQNGKMIFNAMTEGTYVVKRVEDHGLVEYPKELYGHFFTKEAFFIQYSFYPEGSDKQWHILYFWQGRDASVMDAGTLAHKVVEQSGNVETSCQVRVTQGKEPHEFLKIFKGKFIVHLGGFTEYCANRPEIYEIRGKEENLCHMTQMTLPNQLSKYKSAMKLMPGSIYLFKTMKEIVVMKGKNCNKEQEKMIEVASKEFNLPVVYDKNEIIKGMTGNEIEWINHSSQHYNQLRMFKFTYWITAIDIEEIEQPNQRDMNHEFVYMIDSGKIWLWFGAKSIFEMRNFAVQFALQYAKTKGQEKVIVQTQNEESVEFRALFDAWGNTDLLRKNNLRQEYPMVKKNILETMKSIEEGTFKTIDASLTNDITVNGNVITSLKGTTEMITIGKVQIDRSLIFPQIENREKIT